MDNELLQAIEKLLDNKLDPVKTDLADLKTDVTGLKETVGGLETDMSGLKESVGGLKTDVTGIKLHLENTIEPNIKLIAESQLASNEKLDVLNKRVEDMAQDISAIDIVSKTMAHQLQQQGLLNLGSPFEP